MYSSKNPNTIQRKLQQATDILSEYSKSWGMKLNELKTNYIVFHKKKTIFNQNNLHLTLNGKQIIKEKHPKLLGITLDEHLDFSEHFHCLKKSINSKINLIRILNSKAYSINPHHLLTVYKSLILSKIQYSMLPYLVTSKKIRNSLQIIQNKSLKSICKLHYRTSTKLTHTIANIDQLNLRIKNMVIKYISTAKINKISTTTKFVKDFSPYDKSSNYSILDALYPNYSRL